MRDLAGDRSDFFIAALGALCAAFLPYGYVVGLVIGAPLAHLARRGTVISVG